MKPIRHRPHLASLAPSPRPMRGFTLVELLVAMVLGLVLIGGALNMVLTSRNTLRVNDNVMRLQESARTAFEILARDLRETGQIPCGIADTPVSLLQIGNVIRDPKTSAVRPWWADWEGGTLRAWDAATDTPGIVAFGTGTAQRVNGTAAILTLQASGTEYTIQAHDPTAHEFTLDRVSGLAANALLVACDLSSAALFQAATVSTSLNTVDYSAASTTYNCSDNLGAPTPANCATVPAKTFPANGTGIVTPLRMAFWYVGYNGNGGKSLYRAWVKPDNTGTAVLAPDEIVAGVNNLEVKLLTVDLTNASAPALASNWVAPSTITDWSKNALNQVIGVKVKLWLSTQESVGTNPASVPIERQLEHVIKLRNREALLP